MKKCPSPEEIPSLRNELIDLVPPDYVKYFLLREIPVGADGNFSYKLLLKRVNSDLANDLGNLSNRILTMIESYCKGQIPESGEPETRDEELKQFSSETIDLFRENFDSLQVNKAIENVWELISMVNKYIVANEPWAMGDDPAKEDRLGTVLYYSAETLRIIAILMAPIIPTGTASILKQLGVSKPIEDHRIPQLAWGELEKGSPIGKIQAIYPRLDQDELLSRVEKGRQQKESPPPPAQETDVTAQKKEIGIEDFAKVEMRVGKIVSAERVPKSDKLLKVQVDIGSEVRQVVAGNR